MRLAETDRENEKRVYFSATCKAKKNQNEKAAAEEEREKGKAVDDDPDVVDDSGPTTRHSDRPLREPTRILAGAESSADTAGQPSGKD